jgi:hypothetical protein
MVVIETYSQISGQPVRHLPGVVDKKPQLIRDAAVVGGIAKISHVGLVHPVIVFHASDISPEQIRITMAVLDAGLELVMSF